MAWRRLTEPGQKCRDGFAQGRQNVARHIPDASGITRQYPCRMRLPMVRMSVRAIASDLACLERRALVATGSPLPWPAPALLVVKFI